MEYDGAESGACLGKSTTTTELGSGAHRSYKRNKAPPSAQLRAGRGSVTPCTSKEAVSEWFYRVISSKDTYFYERSSALNRIDMANLTTRPRKGASSRVVSAAR